MTSFRLAHSLRSSLWLVPLVGLLGGIGLSFVTLAIDSASDYKLIPQSVTGDASTVQTILSTIAGSTVTLASLVLTVTTVAVQLAMGQFSPRIVRALLNDRWNQAAIGLFAATFVDALLVLREVDDHSAVPGLSVLVALLLMLASIAGLFFYVHHAGGALRASGLIDLVGDNSRRQFDRLYPADPAAEDARDDRTVPAPEPGAVIEIDEQGLVAAARRADCALELVPAMGDFVPAGAPLFRVQGSATGLDPRRITGLVVLAAERTHTDDPAYGFRKLVDIAERSIAEPFEDPTTTVQAIDRLHDGLRQLATRRFPSGRYHDEHGHLRLVTRSIGWDGYVRLAFDEIRLAGAGTPQVTRRLMAALQDLKAVAAPDRHPALDRQINRLEAAVRRTYADEEDVRDALIPDQQGIGSGRDIIPASAVQPGRRVLTEPERDHPRQSPDAGHPRGKSK